MENPDSRQVLWRNVSALMRVRWGGENLNELARRANIGPATAKRMKDCQTSVGLEVVDKVAGAFDVATWQLLVPGMTPENMPTLLAMTKEEREFYARIQDAARLLKNK